MLGSGMDLNDIGIFVRVAERKSFTLAARDLKVSPSVVSKHVTDLERRLGVTLLVRSTRTVSLTEAGEEYFARCTKALAHLSEANSAVSSRFGQPSGTLRVSVSLGVPERLVVPLIPRFLQQHPELRFSLSVHVPPINLVAAGIDIVLGSGLLVDSSLDYRDLVPVRHVICAAPSFFKRHGKPAHPQDLVRFNCLTHSMFSSEEWVFEASPRDLAVKVSGNYESNYSDTLREAAIQGLGIVRIPANLVKDDIAAGRLTAIFADGLRTNQTVRALFPRVKNLPAKTQLFLGFLERHLGEAAVTH